MLPAVWAHSSCRQQPPGSALRNTADPPPPPHPPCHGQGNMNCSIERDLADAKKVAAALKLPLQELDFVEAYWNDVRGLSLPPHAWLPCESALPPRCPKRVCMGRCQVEGVGPQSLGPSGSEAAGIRVQPWSQTWSPPPPPSPPHQPTLSPSLPPSCTALPHTHPCPHPPPSRTGRCSRPSCPTCPAASPPTPTCHATATSSLVPCWTGHASRGRTPWPPATTPGLAGGGGWGRVGAGGACWGWWGAGGVGGGGGGGGGGGVG
jgi:hypothetical protein